VKFALGFISIIAAFGLGWLLKPVDKIAPPKPGRIVGELTDLARLTGTDYSFQKVIEETCEVYLLEYDPGNPAHRAIRAAIVEASEIVRRELSKKGSALREKRRVNEASRFFEDALLAEIDGRAALSCRIPRNSEGKEQRSGYPDLRIEHLESGTVAYLDPKLFEEGSRDSSFRTFYYEPSKRIKVNEDALHFLVGFPHDGKSQEWTFGTPDIVDLSKLTVNLKTEFSASNRELYRKQP